MMNLDATADAPDTKTPATSRNGRGGIRHSLKFLIPMAIVATSCLSGGLFLFISYSVLENDKVRDLNSLKQFQLQSVANYLRDQLIESEAELKSTSQTDLHEMMVGKLKFTMMKGTATGADLQLFMDQSLEITPSRIIMLNGSSGLLAFMRERGRENSWSVVSFDLKEFLSSIFPNVDPALVYVLNNLGEVLFVSNPNKLNLINTSQAPIVIEGIRSNLNNFLMPEIEKKLQVFYAVPDSNLLIVLDQEKIGLLDATWHLRNQFLYAAAFSMIILSIPLILIMGRLSSIFFHLSKTAYEYGIGNYGYRASINTKFLEVRQLISTVSGLGEAIIQRDLRIKRFFEKEKDLVRVQAEINIYDVIKKDFIKVDKESLAASSYSFDYLYLASNRFSGDVISIRKEHRSGAMISMLFDISGHGIASAFYSSALVGLIESHLRSDVEFDFPRLASTIAEVFYSLAKGKMHVTAVCSIYDKDARKVTFHNSGHNPAYILQTKDGKASILRINLPSEPLGFSETAPEIRSKTMALETENGYQIFLYTDGLVEARNDKKIQFGNKRLRKALLSAAKKQSCKDTLSNVHEEMKRHVGQCKQEDDITALAIQIDPDPRHVSLEDFDA